MLATVKQNNSRYQPHSNQPCWWMLAGVVDYKLCDRSLDCEQCPFDLSLRGGARNSEPEASLVSANLEFDFDHSLFYHPAHVWARVEDCGHVRIGLDDFAQKLFGRTYAVSLPHEGSLVDSQSHFWSVTHKAGETSLVVPLEGEVIEVNSKLAQCPSLLNREPFASGWAFIIKPTDLEAGLGNLFYGSHASAWHFEQCEKLYDRATELFGSYLNTMTDGGRLRKDFLSELSADQVLDLIRLFLPGTTGQKELGHRQFALSNLKRR